MVRENKATSYHSRLRGHIASQGARDGEAILQYFFEVRFLCLLTRWCVVADDADLKVRDNSSGFRILEVPGEASLLGFSGLREPAAAVQKSFPDLT